MSQTNTNTNNGHNWNSGRGERGQGAPNGSGRGDCRNDCRNKSIAKYSFEGKMKDGPISKLTITETGHRPSQFKKTMLFLYFVLIKTTVASIKFSIQDVAKSKMTSY